jgi:hypothetical protein
MSIIKNFTLQQKAFFRSEAAEKARAELKLMVGDPRYNTQKTFSAKDPDLTSFVDKHMQYLSQHPKLDPRHYLSNLRLMTKVKR